MTQKPVSSRGGPQAVRAPSRDESALLGEVLADTFAKDPVFAWLIPQRRGPHHRREPIHGWPEALRPRHRRNRSRPLLVRRSRDQARLLSTMRVMSASWPLISRICRAHNRVFCARRAVDLGRLRGAQNRRSGARDHRSAVTFCNCHCSRLDVRYPPFGAVNYGGCSSL